MSVPIPKPVPKSRLSLSVLSNFAVECDFVAEFPQLLHFTLKRKPASGAQPVAAAVWPDLS